MSDWTLSAEVVEKDFEFDDSEPLLIKQVKVNIFGNEFYLDPDQALSLWQDLDYALDILEGK